MLETKVCIDCRQAKPIDSFYRVGRGEEQRQSRCKVCDNRKRAGRLQADAPPPRGHKRPAPPPGTGRVDCVRRADGTIDLVRRGSAKEQA